MTERSVGQRRIPLWLKLAFTFWIAVWAPTYAIILGPQNFFWLCNLANFLLLVALWAECRRLMSMQYLAVLLVGVAWVFDVLVALIAGFHPIGGTEYMFDPAHPPFARALSLYHVMLPIVAVFGVYRLGYDRSALYWQSGLTCLLLFLTYTFADAERNINWVHQPFGQPQEVLGPASYLLLLMALWPLVIYVPSHLLAIVFQHRRD